jgi:hypothetical protein
VHPDKSFSCGDRTMAGAIFGGNINGICTAMMMVAMLMFAVAWEAFTGYLDRKVGPPPGLADTPARPPARPLASANRALLAVLKCSSRTTLPTKKC